MSQLYRVTTKNVDTNIPAKNRQEAYAKLFLSVKNGDIKIDDLGGILMLYDEGEEYPFRTVPTLWLMELISPSMAFATLENMLGLDPSTDDAANLLLESARQDMWILDIIKRLEREAKP